MRVQSVDRSGYYYHNKCRRKNKYEHESAILTDPKSTYLTDSMKLPMESKKMERRVPGCFPAGK